MSQLSSSVTMFDKMQSSPSTSQKVPADVISYLISQNNNLLTPKIMESIIMCQNYKGNIVPNLPPIDTIHRSDPNRLFYLILPITGRDLLEKISSYNFNDMFKSWSQNPNSSSNLTESDVNSSATQYSLSPETKRGRFKRSNELIIIDDKVPVVILKRLQVVRKMKIEKKSPINWSCCLCNQSFSKIKSVQMHVNKKHRKSLNYCNVCGDSFVFKKGLKEHRQKIHGISPEEDLKDKSYLPFLSSSTPFKSSIQGFDSANSDRSFRVSVKSLDDDKKKMPRKSLRITSQKSRSFKNEDSSSDSKLSVSGTKFNEEATESKIEPNKLIYDSSYETEKFENSSDRSTLVLEEACSDEMEVSFVNLNCNENDSVIVLDKEEFDKQVADNNNDEKNVNKNDFHFSKEKILIKVEDKVSSKIIHNNVNKIPSKNEEKNLNKRSDVSEKINKGYSKINIKIKNSKDTQAEVLSGIQLEEIDQKTCPSKCSPKRKNSFLNSKAKKKLKTEELLLITKTKSAACDSCEKTKNALQVALNNVPVENAKFVKLGCPVCPKSFDNTKELQDHLSTSHWICSTYPKCNIYELLEVKTFKKVIVCSQCQKSYISLDHLHKHINAVHRDELGKQFYCASCQKIFNQDDDYYQHYHLCYLSSHSMHLQISHEDFVSLSEDMEMLPCSRCKIRFKDKKTMVFHHMNIHGDSPYICSVCRQCFSSVKDSLEHLFEHNEAGKYIIDCTKKDEEISNEFSTIIGKNEFPKQTRENEDLTNTVNPQETITEAPKLILEAEVPNLVQEDLVSNLIEETIAANLTQENETLNQFQENSIPDLIEETIITNLTEENGSSNLVQENVVSELIEESIVSNLIQENVVLSLTEIPKVIHTNEDLTLTVLNDDTVIINSCLEDELEIVPAENNKIEVDLTTPFHSPLVKVKNNSDPFCQICDKTFDSKKMYYEHAYFFHDAEFEDPSINMMFTERSENNILLLDDSNNMGAVNMVVQELLDSIAESEKHQFESINADEQMDMEIQNIIEHEFKMEKQRQHESEFPKENTFPEGIRINEFEYEINDGVGIKTLNKDETKKKEFSCDQCTQKFLTQEVFNTHKFFVHLEPSRVHICENCNEVMGSIRSVNRHKCSNVTTFYCEHCDTNFIDAATLMQHNFEKHLEKEGTYVCECGKEFFTNRMLVKHMTILHSESKPTIEIPYYMEEEGKVKLHIIPMESQMLDLEKQVAELDNLLNVDHYKEIESHINVSCTCPHDECEMSTFCPICTTTISKKTGINDHYVNKHWYFGDFCKLCGSMFQLTREISHFTENHIVTNNIKAISNPNEFNVVLSTRAFIQALSPASLLSLFLYRLLIEKYNTTEPSKCLFCDEVFENSNYHFGHYLYNHDKVCVLCNQTFSSATLALHHKERKHKCMNTYLWFIFRACMYIANVIPAEHFLSIEAYICHGLALAHEIAVASKNEPSHTNECKNYINVYRICRMLSDCIENFGEQKNDAKQVLLVMNDDIINYKDNVAQLALKMSKDIDQMMSMGDLTQLLTKYIKSLD